MSTPMHIYDNVKIDLKWLHENGLISDPAKQAGQKHVQNTPVRCSRCRSDQDQILQEFGRFNTSVSLTVQCGRCQCIYGLCLQDQCGHTITSEDPENDPCTRCNVTGSVFPEGKEPKRPIAVNEESEFPLVLENPNVFLTLEEDTNINKVAELATVEVTGVVTGEDKDRAETVVEIEKDEDSSKNPETVVEGLGVKKKGRPAKVG